MYSLTNFNLKSEVVSENQSRFLIGPLPSGYGATIANMLRRTLYSSVSGIGITSVKINGILHEYTALRGISDDALRLLFNLKKVVFKGDITSDVTIKLSKVGEGEVLASDFDLPSNITVVNPDQVITIISDSKSKLELEVSLSVGVGYSYANDKLRAEKGVIPLDTDFSSVLNVSYIIEQTREGDYFDLDRINILVQTNGSVSPEDAMKVACETLNKVTSHLVELNFGKVVEVVREYESYSNIRKVDLSIDKLSISTRLYNCLSKMGIESLDNLSGKSKKDINDIKGLGDKSRKELFKILQKYNIDITE